MTDVNVCEPLCRVEQIVDGGAFEASGIWHGERESLVLMRAGDEVRGFLNICPHAGRPLNWAPGQFLVEHGQLICAVHGASFEVPNGYCVMGPCRGSSLREVGLRVEDGQVYLAP